MKADGVEYEQRMEELAKLEYPKPMRDFIYETFNAFADRHPWVGEENIRPKSIAREMFEQFRSFVEYVLDYELQRSEGLLLRHLNSVYKVLSQTVPDGVKTDAVREMELYLGTLLRTVDSSLTDEWERMRDPGDRPMAPAARAGESLRPPGAEAAAADITRDATAFTAAIRTRLFTGLRAWSIGSHAAALDALDAARDAVGHAAGEAAADVAPDLPSDARAVPAASRGAAPGGIRQSGSDAWTVARLTSALEAYRAEHDGPRFDPEARNVRHTHVRPADDGRAWRVQQVMIDAEQRNDWMVEVEVDLPASREANRPVLYLRGLGSIA
jgi:hypothetical protein